ncbi:unnamed protein product [Schistosoma mattheei]|uniref:Uncharacterized protein n=1 Tax=Schistosoma mattheei TaxID=31246 RepID=A0A3P8FY44_9TREM|nr:unnamed protein product [Schistosoma mattheei]
MFACSFFHFSGHSWNNHHWDLEKESQQQQYQDDIDRIDEHNDDNANDDDNQYLYLFNLNRQPSYSTNFRRKVFSDPKINLPIDIDEDVDKLQESASSSSPSPPTDENIEYLNPIWPNLIYYRNPLKKRDWLNENTRLTDNSLIVKKMPETIKWSTPIQPGNSKDLRKLRNLDTFNTEQYKHRDEARSDGTHQKHSRSWTNENESAVNEQSERQGLYNL